MGCVSAIYAQGEVDQQSRVFFRNEWTVAVTLNSNGFGANYRYGQRINAADKRLYEIEFAYMKDPKERKTYARNFYSNARYVEGKKNLAFNFRFGYGKQHEMYRKHDLGGVAIRRFYNFGPSIALLKPIYYEIERATFGEPIPQRLPADIYDPHWLANNVYILSRASFFKGFGGINVIPGAYGKFGYNFEFGSHDRIIHALEAGVIAEGFIKKIEIMDFSNPSVGQTKVAENQQLFLTIFFSYRFGRIVDPYEVRRGRERSREISY